GKFLLIRTRQHPGRRHWHSIEDKSGSRRVLCVISIHRIDAFAADGLSYARQEPDTLLHYGSIGFGFGGSRLQERQTIALELSSDSTSPARKADSSCRPTGRPQVTETSRGPGRGHPCGSTGGQSSDSGENCPGRKAVLRRTLVG